MWGMFNWLRPSREPITWLRIPMNLNKEEKLSCMINTIEFINYKVQPEDDIMLRHPSLEEGWESLCREEQQNKRRAYEIKKKKLKNGNCR